MTLGLLVSAIVLLAPASLSPTTWIPGDPDFPDVGGVVNYHWVVHTQGVLGAAHSRLLAWPMVMDRVVLNGFPLDALASWPFVRLLGWPAGFTVYTVVTLWMLGLSTAWLAARLWRSAQAGLVAGVAMQCSGTVLFDLMEGRSIYVFGAIFLPPALGLLARALVERRGGDAALAGLSAGLALLAYWYFAVVLALGAGALLMLAALEPTGDGRRAWRRVPWHLVLLAGIVALVVCSVPLGYTIANLGDQPGLHTTLGEMIHRGNRSSTLLDLLRSESLHVSDVAGGRWTPRPLAIVLLLAAVFGLPLRRWLLPVCWIAIGLLFALGVGPILPGGVSLPGPFLLLSSLPLVRRFWWPRRLLFLAALGGAVLVGGGLARALSRWPRPALPWMVAVLLIVEAAVLLPQLPLPVTDASRSSRADVLAKGEGPVLVLPSPAGYLRRDSMPLIDQVHHGRPLADWVMHPDDGNVPDAWRLMVRATALGALFACEQEEGDTGRSEEVPPIGLADLGVREVYVDVEALPADPGRATAYLACIEEQLGPPARVEAPFQVYSPHLPPAP